MNDFRQFLRYVIPSMVVMFVAGLYNITDAMFVGRATGEHGLAACLVTFPMYCVLFALADMVAMGGGILISQFHGQNNHADADRVFGQMMAIGILLGVLIPVVFLPICPDLLRFSGATEDLVDGAYRYISIILYTSMVPVLWFSFVAVVRNDGHPKLSMTLVCTGVLLNVFFDWLFLMKFHWGIPGAAWATVVAEVPTLILSMFYFGSRWTKICFQWKNMVPQWFWWRQILKNGFPSFGGHSSVAAMLLFHNWQALRYGQAAGLGNSGLAVYSVISATSSLASMVMQGVAEGIQPIVSFLYGAGETARHRKTAWMGFAFVTILGVLGTFFLIFLRNDIPAWMGLSGTVAPLAARGLLLSASAYLVMGAVKVGTLYFQSTERIFASSLLVYGDYCFVLPACLFFLPWAWGLDGVWLAMPVSRAILFLMLVALWCFPKEKR